MVTGEVIKSSGGESLTWVFLENLEKKKNTAARENLSRREEFSTNRRSEKGAGALLEEQHKQTSKKSLSEICSLRKIVHVLSVKISNSRNRPKGHSSKHLGKK